MSEQGKRQEAKGKAPAVPPAEEAAAGQAPFDQAQDRQGQPVRAPLVGAPEHGDRVTVYLTSDSPSPTYTDDQTHLLLTREPREVAQAELGENTRRQTWVTIEPSRKEN